MARAKYNSIHHVKNLPDAYNKRSDSNNYKILEIERISCQTLRDAIDSIDYILDINNATGATLDMYGERVGQARGRATDTSYLLMIKARIARTMTDGSHESIVKALCLTLDCEPSQVVIVDDEEPYSIKIVTIPLDVINRAGFTTSQTLALIQSLMPIGTTITSFLFEGTFQFSDFEFEYDEKAGFSDVENGDIGGYFGMTQDDESGVILPI